MWKSSIITFPLVFTFQSRSQNVVVCKWFFRVSAAIFNLIFFLGYNHKGDREQRFWPQMYGGIITILQKKRAKIGFDINKNGKTLGEMEDNCVTRQEVLVQNLNEFKGQFNVELFSESRFFCCLLLVFLSLIMLQLSFLFYFAFLSVFWRLVFSDWTICCELSSKSFNPKAIAVPLNFEQWARKQPIIKEDIKIESIILCKKYCAKKTR